MANFQQDLQQYKSQFVDPNIIEKPIGSEMPQNDFQSDLQDFRSKTAEIEQDTLGGVAQEAQNKANVARQAFNLEQERKALEQQLGLQKQLTSEVVENIDQPTNIELIEGGQAGVLPGAFTVTQKFGNYNPAIEPTKDGINYGTDFGTPEGTKLATPPGEWQVVSAYNQARGKGYIGNRENAGYGNSVVLKNTETGETMRFSHLRPGTVAVKGGETLKGGTIFAQTGSTGNVTGPHLDLEYYNSRGQVGDIEATAYRKYLFGGQGGGNTESFGQKIVNFGKKAVEKLSSGIGSEVEDPDFQKLARKEIKYEDIPQEKRDEWARRYVGLAAGITQPVRSTRPQLIDKNIDIRKVNNLIKKDISGKINPNDFDDGLRLAKKYLRIPKKEFNRLTNTSDGFKLILSELKSLTPERTKVIIESL